MTEIIVWNLLTLNGYYNGEKDWQIDWHELIWGEEMDRFSLDQLNEVDGLIFGRKTYEGMADYWKTAEGKIADYMNSTSKLVFSRSLADTDWENSTLVKENLVEYVRNLKMQGDERYFIFGSGEIVSELHNAGLIDEYRLCYVPITLISGTPMFRPNDRQMEFTTIDTRVLKSGGIILFLKPKQNSQVNEVKG